MSGRRRVKIFPRKRLFNDFFKVDRYWVSYELYERGDGGADGPTKEDLTKEDPYAKDDKPEEKPEKGMSEYARRLNFERGDAVGVLLFNRDTRSVVLVEQFKLPTLIGRRRDEPTSQDGWIVEVMAGMIGANESAEEAAIRETEEETGYIVESPELICKFLSSPGGTSERIFLYFATVSDSRRKGKGKYGVADENIRVLQRNVNDLFEQLENGAIDDPKLAIAAYWLKGKMARVETLEPDTVRYEVVGRPGLIIGYKMGDIASVHGVDVWVNSENADMIMDRFIGRSVSAKIRGMGANKNGDSIVDDTIQESLRGLMGERANVDIGTVFVTESGMLGETNDVQRVFHVAAVKGGLGAGTQAKQEDLKSCVVQVLAEVEQANKSLLRRFSNNNLESVLIPLIGAGEGGLPTKTVAREIIPAAVDHFKSRKSPTIKEIYFLAFRLREKSACDTIFDEYCERNVLKRIP
jgi:ADP-ribose pyrophosphatase